MRAPELLVTRQAGGLCGRGLTAAVLLQVDVCWAIYLLLRLCDLLNPRVRVEAFHKPISCPSRRHGNDRHHTFRNREPRGLGNHFEYTDYPTKESFVLKGMHSVLIEDEREDAVEDQYCRVK
jgi:hypothetical protein